MKRILFVLCLAAFGLPAQATEFTGTITALQPDPQEAAVSGSPGAPPPPDGTAGTAVLKVENVVIDGRAFPVDSDTGVALKVGDDRQVGGSLGMLQPGFWVRYSVSNDTGRLGVLEYIVVTGPASKIESLEEAWQH